MDADDDSLGFMASLLSYSVQRGDLTDRQYAASKKIHDRVLHDWKHGMLDCQRAHAFTVIEGGANGQN